MVIVTPHNLCLYARAGTDHQRALLRVSILQSALLSVCTALLSECRALFRVSILQSYRLTRKKERKRL